MNFRDMPMVFWFSSAAALSSILLAVYLRMATPCGHREVGYALLGAWVALPPLWFVYEFNKEFPRGKQDTDGNFERFKHGQDLARNLWLALVVILSAIIGLELS